MQAAARPATAAEDEMSQSQPGRPLRPQGEQRHCVTGWTVLLAVRPELGLRCAVEPFCRLEHPHRVRPGVDADRSAQSQPQTMPPNRRRLPASRGIRFGSAYSDAASVEASAASTGSPVACSIRCSTSGLITWTSRTPRRIVIADDRAVETTMTGGTRAKRAPRPTIRIAGIAARTVRGNRSAATSRSPIRRPTSPPSAASSANA